MAQLSFNTLEALDRLTRAQSAVSTSAKKLATGKQVPDAATNPAALAIAKALQVELEGQTQALRNTNDGVSLVQTAEGGLDSIQSQLGRLRELAVQGSSGTLSGAQRDALNTESNAILQEINRLAGSAQFNGQNLLNGALSSGVAVQAGINAGDQIVVTVGDSRTAALGITTADNLSSSSSARSFLGQVDEALRRVSARRSDLGAVQNRLHSAASNLRSTQESTAAAHSRIADVEVAAEAANLVRAQILQRAGVSVLAQTAHASAGSLQLIR